MLVVNIGRKLDPDPAPAPAIEPANLPDPDRVLAAARGPWKIPVAWMNTDGDRLVAVNHDYILGVFHIVDVHRDNRTVTLDLQPAIAWQSLVGNVNPIDTYGDNSVRTADWSQLIKPADMAAPSGSLTINGWTLQVADDRRSAVVSGPTSLTVTALQGTAAHLAIAPTPDGPTA